MAAKLRTAAWLTAVFLKPDWGGNGICSEIAKGMPLLCFYDNDDCARLTAALSN